ncbi:GNAT family N-acetyltransferase [Fodinicola feengrottensis]|uniref:N-acetyltransferase domain-containing protein n=1 Tax=Fodinicola feengrottensis TaxID=435914 RepID=A0ABN2IR81_9ACTN|nr:GNAT family N-acetyltransferase [Fodinicola feengrottensis]
MEIVLRFAAIASDVAIARRPLSRAAVGRPLPAHRSRYEALLRDPDRHVVIVEDDAGDPAGMGVLAEDRTGPLHDLPAARLSHVVVERHRRGQGAGRSLIGAAAAFAEQIGAEHVVAGVVPASREGNRFFARLGFVPLAIHRVASLSLLRRNLAVPEMTIDFKVGEHREPDAGVA